MLSIFRAYRLRAVWFGAAAGLFAFGLLLPWWRNHGLLRDFYDYGNVMAAAGRIQLGDRPYVDFLTPIQTLQFYQAVLAERIFGPRYMSLTYAAAIFIVLSYGLFVALLAKPLGRPLALLIAAAVVAGTSVQHTILWYNAMGVAWLAIVMWILARVGPERATRRYLLAAVFLALWLGGLTKLTYQTAALAFFALFTIGWAQQRLISWRVALAWLAGGAVSGVFLPLVTELWMTGASWSQWTNNVFRLAHSRVELLKAIATPQFYLHTPHDYYRPMMFGAVGLWGMTLLAWTGVMAIGAHRTTARGSPGRLLMLIAALGGSVCCGLVFLAAHFEIAYMAGAAWLLLATGLVIGFVPASAVWANRGARIGLVCGAITLLLPAWVSAWAGARSIWGRETLVRSTMVSTNDLPANFDYIKPVRVLPSIHDALVEMAKVHETLVVKKVPESSYYFSQGTEWLVRVVPESRHRGLPLWTQAGTTYNTGEIPLFLERLGSGTEIQTVVVETAWETWLPKVKEILDHRYEREPHGDFGIYRLKPGWTADCLTHPVLFAQTTSSNFYSPALTATGGEIFLNRSTQDGFLGSNSPFELRTRFAVQDWGGEMRAERLPHSPPGEEQEIVFRVREFTGNASGRVLVEQKTRLTQARPIFRQPFELSAPAAQVVLEVVRSANENVVAGWSHLRMKHSIANDAVVPWPLDPTLQAHAATDQWRSALLAENTDAIGMLAGFGLDVHPDGRDGVPELFCHASGEVWMQTTRPVRRISGEFGLREGAWRDPNALPGVRVTVVCEHGGRFEVLFERELRPKTVEADRAPQTFDVAIPESPSSVGILVRSLDPNRNAWGHGWIRGVRVVE